MRTVTHNRITIWTKKLEIDYLPELEEKFFKLNSKVKKLTVNSTCDLLQKIIDNGGTAHAIPINSEDNNNKIWLFNVRWEPSYNCNSYSFNWVDRPDQFVNRELGQELYKLDRRCNQLYRRLGIFREIFVHLLNKKLQSLNERELSRKIAIFTINEREYVLKYNSSKYCGEWNIVESTRIQL